jgi:integral membrane sensor domain MASE1
MYFLNLNRVYRFFYLSQPLSRLRFALSLDRSSSTQPEPPGMAKKVARAWCFPSSLVAVCAYIAAYIFLDRISLLQALPNIGFTLWNPPPACSLALLLIKGLHFAPALYVAAVLGDVLNGAVSIGMMPVLVLDGIIAAGYTGVALLLRAFVRPGAGLQSVRDVGCFLGIIGIGVLGIAYAAGEVLVLMGVIPSEDLAKTVRYFWIGDVTGIVALLPAAISAPFAWKRWYELPPRERIVDLGAFALGLALALSVVFVVGPREQHQFLYLLLLPVIWIGVRHGLP